MAKLTHGLLSKNCDFSLLHMQTIIFQNIPLPILNLSSCHRLAQDVVMFTTSEEVESCKNWFSSLSRMTLKAVLGVLAGYALARASRALNFRREAAERQQHSRGKKPLSALLQERTHSVLISTSFAF